MYKLERKEKILNILEEMGFCSTKELADKLGVSRTTIYRDLSDLEEAGVAKKEYGGVTPVSQAEFKSHIEFDVRRTQQIKEKRAVAIQAVKMIEDGDSLFLDASSTCYVMAQELTTRRKYGLTVITNSPRNVITLRDNPECETICTGGTYLKEFDSLAGSPAEEYIETINVEKCFFSVLGISPDACTDSEQQEANLKKKILARAKTKILLVDHSKFNRFGTFKVTETVNIDVLITDWQTPIETEGLYEKIGLQVIRASNDT